MNPVLSDTRAVGLPLHTRSLSVLVSREADGRHRARGDVVDLRKNGCVPSVDDVQPAGIIHMMGIDLDFDPGSLRLDRIAVEQPFVAVEPSPATGGECCRDPAPRLVALCGEHLDPGFTRRLGTAFGGSLGCSHLLTLFQLMASTVPRAITLERRRIAREGDETATGTRFLRRALTVDGQQLPDDTIDVAIQLTDTHTRPPFPGNRGFERLVEVREVKLFAAIERKRFSLLRFALRERQRGIDDPAGTPWIDHGKLLAPLVGVPVLPGMAARVFALLGSEPDHEGGNGPLRDTLLQLAPGFIQITAALMDHDFRSHATDARADGPATPSVSGIGGMPDSCYMWRKGSPFTEARRAAMLPKR